MALDALRLGLPQFLMRVVWTNGHPLSLGYSLGIRQGEEYRDVPATSSPGHPACYGPFVPSPLFLLEQELF